MTTITTDGRHGVAAIAAGVLYSGMVCVAVNVFSSTEAEAGTRSGNVAVAADTTASGNSAVKFGMSPNTCPQSKRTIIAQDVTDRTASGYPAGTQVFVPDGPDPWGGCFPSVELRVSPLARNSRITVDRATHPAHDGRQ